MRIPVKLSFPYRSPVHILAFIDSGAQTSLIGEHIVSRHGLRTRALEPRLSLQTFNGQPALDGLVSQSVLTHLSLDTHSEFKSFGVARMPHSLILGLDWLMAHNPSVDWAQQHISFSCCGLGLTETGDARLPDSPATQSPNGSADRIVSSLNSVSTAPGPATSVALSPEPSISLVSATDLASIADVTAMGLIRYVSLGSSVSSVSADSGIPASGVSDLDMQRILSQLPSEYHSLADRFREREVEVLAPHRPSHDIRIDLEEGKTPPFGPIYSLTREERDALHKYIEENLAKGFIRPSSSPAASPILFVKKANGALRLCVDYRGLNAITKRNRYPLPLLNDLLNLIRGSTIFTKLDLKSAFNLLRIAPGDEWKTAFRTNEGLFEYLVMPFGLTNAPAAFQSFMQWVLRDMLDIHCVVYLDDILIFSRNRKEHVAHVTKVLQRLREYGLFCGIDKCEFGKEELEYLGFLIGHKGVRMHPKKLESIANWPEPHSIRAVQKWLGFTNFYRRFIDHYADIATPLHNLTKKSTPHPFSLTPEARSAFLTLRDSFTKAPFLLHFDDSKESFLFTDASDFAISGILHQHGSDGNLHPIAYFSRKLEPAEINYDVHDKEMLAVVTSLREFRHWLSGTIIPISIITDHNNLRYFMSQRQLNRRQSRWAMELSEFNFRLSYSPGKSNPADPPSRREDYFPTDGDPTVLQNHQRLLSEEVCSGLWITAQPAARVFACSIVSLAVDSSLNVQRLSEELEQDEVWKTGLQKKGSLFKHVNGVVTFDGRIYIPPSLRLPIFLSRHDSALAGHFGRAKTLELIRRDFSWPGISKDVASYVRGCDSCQRVKSSTHAPYGPLDPLQIPDTPWSSISMDFITGLPTSHSFDSVFVVVDRLTKQAHFTPTTTDIDAARLASLYISTIVRLHGVPDSIISDRGSVFVSSFWRELQSRLGTKTKYSTAFHPRTDGQTERVNAILESYLRHFCSYQQDDWVDYLGLAEFAYNNAASDATKISPFFANYGYHPRLELSPTHTVQVPAADNLADRLRLIREELIAQLRYSQERAKLRYDTHRSPSPTLEVGDLVMLLRRNIKTTRPSPKLDFRKLGPFKIAKKLSNKVYQLSLPPSLSRLHPNFNVDLLEPYTPPSSFPGRSDPPSMPAPTLEEGSTPGLAIKSILEVRQIGRRFDYLVDFEDQPASETSWVPLSDIPANYNERIEQFHRRNPRHPRPADSTLFRSRPISNSNSKTPHAPIAPIHDSSSLPVPENSQNPQNTPTPDSPIPDSPSASTPFPFSSSVRTHQPSDPKPPSLRTVYTPPHQTTTRSGRVSRPADRDAITRAVTENTR